MKRKPRPIRTADRLHGDQRDTAEAGTGAFAAVYAMVRRIPRGHVMTYGQIANEIEDRLSPRAVGWALNGCPSDVPWQRVVNATGGCSTDRLADSPRGLQRALLEEEGIAFRDNGTLDLLTYRWIPAD
ncbi:MAG: MGMT family protein [Acidobacteriota bacterium]|nr:MGMT family protein [Acidobacteriota bacterium]